MENLKYNKIDEINNDIPLIQLERISGHNLSTECFSTINNRKDVFAVIVILFTRRIKSVNK